LLHAAIPVTAYPGTTSNMSSTLLHRPVISSGTLDIANDLAAMIRLIDCCSYILSTIGPCRIHPASVDSKIAMFLDQLDQQTSYQQSLSSCSSMRFRPAKEQTFKQCWNTRVLIRYDRPLRKWSQESTSLRKEPKVKCIRFRRSRS
jgi:hypothetical protein